LAATNQNLDQRKDKKDKGQKGLKGPKGQGTKRTRDQKDVRQCHLNRVYHKGAGATAGGAVACRPFGPFGPFPFSPFLHAIIAFPSTRLRANRCAKRQRRGYCGVGPDRLAAAATASTQSSSSVRKALSDRALLVASMAVRPRPRFTSAKLWSTRAGRPSSRTCRMTRKRRLTQYCSAQDSLKVIMPLPATCQLVWQEPMFEGLRRGSSPKLTPFPALGRQRRPSAGKGGGRAWQRCLACQT